MKRFITIDPGISGTGWAVFVGKELVNWGIITSKCETWQERAIDITERLVWNARTLGIQKFFCEWPTGRFSSGAGIAAQNTDAILKLTFLIGAIQGMLDMPMTLIPVIKWKGNLKKTIVAKRVLTWLRENQPNLDTAKLKSHAMDAVGIGKYCIEAGLV